MPPRTRGTDEIRRETDDSRPTVGDLEENVFVQVAKAHWLKKATKKAAKVKVKADVLKLEIWDELEKDNFSFKSLLILENLQILERSAANLRALQTLTDLTLATFGQAILRIPPTFMFYL